MKREAKLGMLEGDGAAPSTSVAITPKPYQQAFAGYLSAAAASDEPLSAMAWKRSHPGFDNLPGDIWLHCVVYEAAMERRRLDKYLFERVEAMPDHPLSGNIVVRDVVARRVE